MRKDVDNIRYIYSDSVWYENNQIWLSAIEYNGLYRYDMESNHTTFLGGFPNEANNEARLHSKAIKVENEIYFLPYWSKYVHVYNVITGLFSYYDMNVNGKVSCMNGVYYKSKIYFICNGLEITVCSIDITTKRIEKQKIEVENWKYGIGKDIVFLDGKIYFVCKYPNVVVEYLCEKNTYKKYWVGEYTEGFGTICYDGKWFWLSGKMGIIRWSLISSEWKEFNHFPSDFGMHIRISLDSDKIEMIDGFSDRFSEAEMPFWFSVFLNRKVWLFPYRTNMIVSIDIVTGNIEEIHLQGEQEDEKSLLAKHRYTFCHYLGDIQDKKLIFVSTKSKQFRMIKQDDRFNMKEFYIKCKEPDDMFSYINGENLDIRYEDNDLNSLIEFLAIKSSNKLNSDSKEKNIGNVIYEIVREG